MNVIVADDHPMVREALAQTVALYRADVVVHAAADLDSLLGQALRVVPDLAVVDLNMPGMNGLAGLRELRARQPTLPFIVVSGQTDPGTALAVLDSGAAGFVPKTATAELLLHALRVVQSGQVYLPPHEVVTLQVQGNAGLNAARAAQALTPRQRDVLGLLMRGAPNREIATRLSLTEGTVKLHIAAILRTLRARNRTEAVVRARALGIDQLLS